MREVTSGKAVPLRQSLFEMASLRQKTTGLPFYVWISPKGGARHDVRVKVSQTLDYNNSKLASVALRPAIVIKQGRLSSAEFQQLQNWIKLNYQVIIDYWDAKLDTEAMIGLIQPV